MTLLQHISSYCDIVLIFLKIYIKTYPGFFIKCRITVSVPDRSTHTRTTWSHVDTDVFLLFITSDAWIFMMIAYKKKT
jgi:hypothetical protein